MPGMIASFFASNFIVIHILILFCCMDISIFPTRFKPVQQSSPSGVSKEKEKGKQVLLEEAKKREMVTSTEVPKKVAHTLKSTPGHSMKDDEPTAIDYQVLEALSERLLKPLVYVNEIVIESSQSEIKEHEGMEALLFATSVSIFLSFFFTT